MMWMFFKAESLGLFDAPVDVAGHVRGGRFVAPYRSTRRKKPAEPAAPERSTMGLFDEEEPPKPAEVAEPEKRTSADASEKAITLLVQQFSEEVEEELTKDARAAFSAFFVAQFAIEGKPEFSHLVRSPDEYESSDVLDYLVDTYESAVERIERKASTVAEMAAITRMKDIKVRSRILRATKEKFESIKNDIVASLDDWTPEFMKATVENAIEGHRFADGKTSLWWVNLAKDLMVAEEEESKKGDKEKLVEKVGGILVEELKAYLLYSSKTTGAAKAPPFKERFATIWEQQKSGIPWTALELVAAKNILNRAWAVPGLSSEDLAAVPAADALALIDKVTKRSPELAGLFAGAAILFAVEKKAITKQKAVMAKAVRLLRAVRLAGMVSGLPYISFTKWNDETQQIMMEGEKSKDLPMVKATFLMAVKGFLSEPSPFVDSMKHEEIVERLTSFDVPFLKEALKSYTTRKDLIDMARPAAVSSRVSADAKKEDKTYPTRKEFREQFLAQADSHPMQRVKTIMTESSGKKPTQRQTEAALQSAVERIAANAVPWTCISLNALAAIIAGDGYFKNQSSTGSSGGMLDPIRRERMEEFMWDLPGGRSTKLRKIDATSKSSVSEENALLRPKYGYLCDADDRDGYGLCKKEKAYITTAYGDVHVRFKERVRERTTFTFGDSLSTMERDVRKGETYGSLVEDACVFPSPLNKPDWHSMGVFNAHTMKDVEETDSVANTATWGYIEAQFHGHLTLDDVEEVVLDKKIFGYVGAHYSSTQLLDFITLLNGRNIPWRIEGQSHD